MVAGKGINLLKESVLKEQENALRKKKLNLILMGFLGVFVLLSLAVLTSFLLIKQQLKKNDEEIERLKGEIMQYQEIELVSGMVSERIKKVSTIFSSEDKYLGVLNDFYGLIKDSRYSIVSFDVLSGGIIVLKVGSKDVDEFVSLERVFNEYALSKDFLKNYAVESVIRNKDGSYEITLKFSK